MFGWYLHGRKKKHFAEACQREETSQAHISSQSALIALCCHHEAWSMERGLWPHCLMVSSLAHIPSVAFYAELESSSLPVLSSSSTSGGRKATMCWTHCRRQSLGQLSRLSVSHRLSTSAIRLTSQSLHCRELLLWQSQALVLSIT